MENDINSYEILCIKIAENQRKSFYASLVRGMNTTKKYLFEFYVAQAFFYPPVTEF